MGEWNAPHLQYVDHHIMPLVDLCNIACGAHAGSKVIMKHTINLARKNNVKVGAHPGYNDTAEFGRTYIPMDPRELKDLIQSQIDLFLEYCLQMNIIPFHIKPHGALYHACNNKELEAEVMIDLMKNQYSELILLVAPNSHLSKSASQEDISILNESFIDRTYNEDLSLLSRKMDGSVIVDEKKALGQYKLLKTNKVEVSTGSIKPLKSQSACVHGDNLNVLSILKAIKDHG